MGEGLTLRAISESLAFQFTELIADPSKKILKKHICPFLVKETA